MADQPLIDYQLKLQSDEEELAEFRKGGESTRVALIRNGIPDEDGLHEALIAGDEEKIRARLTLESSHGSGAHKNLAGGVWIMTHLKFKKDR